MARETNLHPDLIVHNARIYTMDSRQPWSQAVACREGRFVAVGDDKDVLCLAGPRTRVIDVEGRMVLPGLTDAHVHLEQHAVRNQEVSLFGMKDLNQVREKIHLAVALCPPGGWVLGWGWDELYWDTPPHRRLLDDIAPTTPVVLRRMDLHTWWVNSTVLNLAGVDEHTPDPTESRIERDEDGCPTGVLREWNAIGLVEPLIPVPDEDTTKQWLRDIFQQAHRLGLTGVHDQRVKGECPSSFRLFQDLLREGNLELRVHMNITAESLSMAAEMGLQSGFGNDRLWIGHVKAFADGSMGSRSASMLEPFEGQPDNRGVVVTSPEELYDLLVRAEDAGFSLSVHAIGDRAVRDVLDTFNKRAAANHKTRVSGPPSAVFMPHRIEHVQLIHPLDLPRLAEGGIVASVQPVHLETDWPTADRVWGTRSRYAYAFRSLLEKGTCLVFGSDAPVAPWNPMLGICAAVTRQDWDGQPADGWYPEERIEVADAIYGYTLGPARAAGKLAVLGSIETGKWADLVVLTHNLFEIPPADIRHVQVYMTVFDGKVVFLQE